MKNYKALKSSSKVSVKKEEVTMIVAVDAVKFVDGDVLPDGKKVGDARIAAQDKVTKDIYKCVSKSYNPNTGEANDDVESEIDLRDVDRDLSFIQSEIDTLKSRKADLEELKKDIEAL